MLSTYEICGVITLCLLLVAFIYCAYWVGRKHGDSKWVDDILKGYKDTSPYSYKVTAANRIEDYKSLTEADLQKHADAALAAKDTVTLTIPHLEDGKSSYTIYRPQPGDQATEAFKLPYEPPKKYRAKKGKKKVKPKKTSEVLMEALEERAKIPAKERAEDLVKRGVVDKKGRVKKPAGKG